MGSGEGGINDDAKAKTMYIGDDLENRQFRIMLSFDTRPLPNDARVFGARVEMRQQLYEGSDPFYLTGFYNNLWADMKEGSFGNDARLQNNDFEAVADLANAFMMSEPAGNGSWSKGKVPRRGLRYINTTGYTQFRFHFEVPTNSNDITDVLGFWSSNTKRTRRWPLLVLKYFDPP